MVCGSLYVGPYGSITVAWGNPFALTPVFLLPLVTANVGVSVKTCYQRKVEDNDRS
jgi:hypothetical protein